MATVGVAVVLKISAEWSAPIRLREGSRQNLIYTCDELEDFPDSPGVYVFGRVHGQSVTPLYIGQATDLATRLDAQFNNVRLMTSIRRAPVGRRILLLAEVTLRRGQQVERVLDVLESALIQHALTEGASLVNIQGTRTPAHEITFRGNRTSRKVAPLTMRVRSR